MSTIDKIFYFSQMLEKKREYNSTERHLFIDLKKAYDLIRSEILYNILIEFGVPMKLILVKRICMCSKICIGKHSAIIVLCKSIIQGDALLTLLFNFALEYSIRRV
jgi:hypothetical protein